MTRRTLFLFGADMQVNPSLNDQMADQVSIDRDWNEDDWTASDDRVRGGKSNVGDRGVS